MGPVVRRQSRPAWRGVDRTGSIQMVSWAAYGIYKVDQASGQWQWYSLDNRPTAVGGREHVLPQGALYIDPRTERCGCEYFF